MAEIAVLEKAAEAKYGLPDGLLSSIRSQETGGSNEYVTDPSKYHYPLNDEGKRVAGHTGKVSTAFGPYGILESTAAQPGYGVTPLPNKELGSQVDFAAGYLAGRTNHAGSLQAGLAGYGEGNKYANQVLARLTGTNTMATQQVPASQFNIGGMATENVARNDAAALAIEGFAAQSQQLINQANNLTKENAEHAALIKNTEMMARASTQAASHGIAVSLGVVPGQGNYVLDGIAKQHMTAYNKNMKYADRLEHATDLTNIYKDPLSWIGNALFYDINEKGEATTRRQATFARETYIGLNQMAQSSARTQQMIEQSVTAGSAAAAGEMAKNEILIQSTKMDLDAVRTASEATLKAAQLKNDNMSVALRARDQQLQEVGMANSMVDAELRSESLRAAMEDRRERTALKQEEAASRDNMLEMVNKGRDINGGLPPFRTFTEMQTAIKLDKDLATTVTNQYQAGLIATQTGQTALAKSPYEAVKYVAKSGAQFSDGRARIIEYLGGVQSSITNNPQQMATIKKETDLASAIDTTARGGAATMLKNIAAGSRNIYSAPPISILNADPELGKTYLATQVLSAYADLGNKEVNFNYATNAMVAAVQSKQITMEQANEELGFLANKVMAYNNAQFRYNATAGLPDMKSVNVPLEDNGMFRTAVNDAVAGSRAAGNPVGAWMLDTIAGGNNEVIVDLSNGAARSAYLNKRMAGHIPSVIRQQSGVSGSKIGGR